MPLKYKVAVVTVAALFIDLLDLTIVNIAVPALRGEFDTPIARVQWAVTAYVLVVAAIMPASGWAADRFGSKRIFLFALAIFTAGSALCASAWDVDALITARALQGVGGGMLVPVGMALLFRAFPEDERAKASAILSVPAAAAPALGPLLGGAFVDTIGWRWVFVINVPIGILAFVLALFWLDEHRVERVGRLDVPGWMAGATGLALVTLALSNASDGSFVQPVVLGPFSFGLVALALFIRIELRTDAPMVDLGMFTRRPFALGNATMFLASAGFGALLFALPLFLQGPYGLSVRATGLLLACHAVGIILSTITAPKLLRLIETRALLGSGLTGSAVATAAFAMFSENTPPPALGVVLLVGGASFGLLIVPLQTVPFDCMNNDSIARGTGILGVVRQLGVALGTAAVSVPLGHALAGQGFPSAFVLAAVLTLVALPTAIAIPRFVRQSAHQ
ncbi:DHA2 family efflux MFS transporter permease subunit [Rhodococcus sp. 114MFTsu3.1]|uniref:DHA2 family efflux MFS transporter permease subunit n=1 Tax=Rhodococcus sp. 114MFTsu3.1 TaxID=1172184 RepID=UPI00037FFDD4|nr:DHA2 family efflux MFS transporter permease subunit [Rhodococcus sp. 114MFTsu3.1]